MPPDRLRAEFDATHTVVLTTSDIPTRIENAPVIGETAVLTLDNSKAVREQAVAFKLAAHLQQHHFPHQIWLMPQLVAIVRQWMQGGVDYGDETFPGLLLFAQKAHEAAEKIKRAIVKTSGGAERVRATLPLQDALGTTAGVSYDTLKTVWTTDPTKCHLNFVPEDSGWETKVVGKIERMDEVRAYVKNQSLGFRIPYVHEGRPGNYYPDLILKIDDGRGDGDLLNLIVEVSGQELKEKQAKVETAKGSWVPAVNAERRFGRWAFLEIDNPDKAMGALRAFIAGRTEESGGA